MSAAKSALGIHSPSKVFADAVGAWIPSGIASGIEDNQDDATDAVEEMSEQLTDQAEELNGATINRQLSTTFSPKFEQKGDTMSDLLEAFKEYGEKVISASKRQIVLDTGVLVGETVDKIDQALGTNYELKARGV